MSPPLSFTKMPAPALPDPADGFDAFDDSVKQANTNLNTIPPWAAPIKTAVYDGQSFTATTVTALTGWRVDSFNAYKINHLIHMDAQLTLTGAAITSTAGGGLQSPLFTMANTGLRPITQWTSTSDARLNDTGVWVIIGYATLDAVSIWHCSALSRTFATGSVLRFHAAYLDQGVDTTLTP